MTVSKPALTPQTIHLPNLRSKPSFATLYAALSDLALQPNSWNGTSGTQALDGLDAKIANHFLLSVVSSELAWFQDGLDEAVASDRKDEIWALASKRMAERCGRSAMPEMTRTWLVPAPITASQLAFSIREPPLTGDNLGLKTWGTAFTMAQKLDDIATKYFPHLINESTNPAPCTQVLELGSGTGLVGIAAAAIWSVPVLLTDLPEIQSNLHHNVLQNMSVIEAQGGHIASAVLDWKEPSSLATGDFEIVVVFYPMYDDEHPGLVARMIERFLKRDEGARALVAVPLRDRNTAHMAAGFKDAMSGMGLSMVGQGEEVCRDDWEEGDGVGVVCWWSVWAWTK